MAAYRRSLPELDELVSTPFVPYDLSKTTVKELQAMKNSLTTDSNNLTRAIYDSQAYARFIITPDYMPALRTNRIDLERVNTALNNSKKTLKTAKTESLAAREAIPPSIETLLSTLNGTFVINPLFSDIASELELDTKGFLKDDKIKTIVKFYHKKTPLLKEALEILINKMGKPQLDSTLKMLSSDENNIIPKSIVKSLKSNDEKRTAILNILDSEIFLDASKRGAKTTDGRRRPAIPHRANELIHEFVGDVETKKAGVKKKRKKSTRRNR